MKHVAAHMLGAGVLFLVTACAVSPSDTIGTSGLPRPRAPEPIVREVVRPDPDGGGNRRFENAPRPEPRADDFFRGGEE